MRKLYSIREANLALPYVRSIVREVRERYGSIKEHGHQHNRLPETESDRRAALKEEIRAQAQRIHECMQELRAIDLELKDYELGLVDFPARLDGRDVLLCWKYDEPEVGHWHELDAGFDGRRSIASPAARG